MASAFSRTPDQYPIMERRRPPMLKDFLTADDSNSCSSSVPHRIPRTRSKAATSSTISALHALLLAALKRFHSLKSPPAITLPRSLTRRRSKKKDHEPKKQLTVTIKDIIRWRSFRDLAEDESPAPALVFESPPRRECTAAASLSSSTATTTSSSSSSTPSSSSGWSWCDSDFTAEELPRWDGSSNSPHNKKDKFYGRVGVVKDAVNPKVGPEAEEVGYEFEDDQQQLSPISVLDTEYEQQQQKKKKKKKTKKVVAAAKWEVGLNLENLMAAAAEEEEEDSEVERMAMQLVEHVKATTSVAGFCFHHNLLLGFFTEALLSRSSSNELVFGELNEMIEEAESWINGQQRKLSFLDLGLVDRSSRSWIQFREEQEEETVEIETWVTNLLVDEIVDDLFCSLQ